LENTLLRHFHEKQKILFGKSSVETFPSKTKNLLEKFPLKNSVEKFPLKNHTLPGQSPRVKRNEKLFPPRADEYRG
jgi:hypothetical protein